MTRAEAFQELKEKLQGKGSGNLFDFHWRRLEEYVRRYDTAGESEKKLLEADFDVSYKKGRYHQIASPFTILYSIHSIPCR